MVFCAKEIEEVSLRLRDAIVSCGERLAAAIVGLYLRKHGIEAVDVNLGDALGLHVHQQRSEGSYHDHPKYLGPSFYNFAALSLAKHITAVTNSSVTVVTGFFGKVPGSLMANMGRGYSDLTAGLVGVGVGADELVIWKEVDGVFSADPAKVPKACRIGELSPSEASELTHYGAEVIHPFTTRLVTDAGIAIRIRSIHHHHDHHGGSLIVPTRHTALRRQGGPIAVSTKDGVTLVNATPKASMPDYEFFGAVFMQLKQHAVSIDLVSSSRSSITMALVPHKGPGEFEAVLEALRSVSTLTLQPAMTILSVIGEGMRRRPGSSSRFFSVLGERSINVEMISQGASELNISCVIATADATAALQAVHAGMIEGGE